MAGPGLPTTLTAGASGHVGHSNTAYAILNKFDTANATTAGFVQVGNGSLYVARALLSTDIPGIVINAQSGTTYTLVLADAGKWVELANGSAIALTVPPNSSVAFPVGSMVTLAQTGAGQVTVAGGAGVTVNGAPGLKLTDQWSTATLVKRATDTWLLAGRLSA